MHSKLYMLFISILFLSAGMASAQDTTYFKDDGSRVNSLQAADSYSVLQRNLSDSHKAVLKSYYRSGKLKSESSYANYGKELLTGESKSYYENGQLKGVINYNDSGKVDGQVLTFWENGKPKRKDQFKDGKLVKGVCYNAQGHPIPHFAYQQMPEFPGGETALLHYLGAKIKYPKRPRKKNIMGEVLVKFVVNKQGAITDPHIVKSVDDDLSAEALRVVRSMPKWKPGSLDGEAVSVEYNLPIRFVLQ